MKGSVKSILLFSIGLLSVGCRVQKNSQQLTKISDLKNTKALQQSLVDEKKIASSQLFIHYKGKEIYNEVVNSKQEGDSPINDQTLFPIWSMTKPIVTVAIMQLLEEGAFTINDPISNFLSEFKNVTCKDANGNIYPCKNEITIEHLLTHTSGISYEQNELDETNNTKDKKYGSLKDFSHSIAQKPLSFEPGENYVYGYSTAILGRLIESVTHKNLESYLKDAILNPLEMYDTSFVLKDGERDRLQPLYIEYNDPKFSKHAHNELSYQEGEAIHLGGEGLLSTAADYARFCQMLLNAGMYKGKRIIEQTSIDQMVRPRIKNQMQLYYPGCDMAYTFFNLTDPKLDNCGTPSGIYGWAGHHFTYFWIDPSTQLFGVFMTRKLGGDSNIWREIRKSVYTDLNLN